MPIGSDTEIVVQLTAETAQLQAGMDAGAASVTSSTDAIKASVADTAASVAASQAEMTASVAGAATTWREFVTERMGEYMRLEGGHAAAMKRMGAEWAQYKTTLAGAGEASVKTGATIAASTEEAAAAVTAANTVIGESADAAANRIRAMVRASLEQVSANSIVGESERSLAERQGLRVEATQAEIAATAEAVAAQNAQMVAVEEFIGAQTEQVAITEADTVAIVENTGAKVLNARVSGELGTMLGEVLSGNFGRLRRSAGALANQTGLLAKAFTPVGMAVLGASAAVIAFGVAAVKGAEEQAKFNNAILMTGGAAGASSSAVQQMAENIGQASGSFANANEAMLSIVKSGRFAADQLQTVGTAAVEMSRLTGESVDKSVQAFVKLQEKPVQAVVALNDQYHFLTASVFDQISALQQQGDVQGAAKAATEAYASALAQRAKESEAQLNALGKAWNAVGAEASWAWNAMMHLGETDGLDQQISSISEKLKTEQSKLKILASSWGDKGAVIEQTQVVEGLTSQLNSLVAARNKVAAADAAKGKKEADAKQTIDEIAAQEKFNASLKDTSRLQDAIAEAKKRAEAIHKADPGSASIKGINFDASGAVAGGEQWDATVKKLTKEYGERLAPAIHASGAAARKASQEAVTALEMQRMGTAANTAERIQADAAILASATKLYGAMSQQQASALRQMLADAKSYDAAYLKSQQDVEKQIEKDHKKNEDAIAKASKDAAAKAAAAWKGYLDPINHAFQQSINGMIQGTQTLRQMTANILQSITASYLQEGLKQLEKHIITEQAKTAATAAGAAERATIEAGAAVKSKALDAATGKSQITSAAATGAAKAYQAIVGIPFVGPVLAPIAAGVAFAGIEAFSGMISSARGGWERVPFDGAMTELHKDEMVLPAHVANPIRQMAAGGGQGGGMTVNLSSTDPRGFQEYLRRNPAALSNALKHAHKRGHFAGALR